MEGISMPGVAKRTLAELLFGKRVKPPLPAGRTGFAPTVEPDPPVAEFDESASASIYIEYTDA